MTKVIFLGNGPLADSALSVLKQHFEIIFHAKTAADLETVKKLKKEHKDAHAILASFGVLIKNDVLELFESEGILNIHPSLLPDLRGASPIESAILRGDTDFSVSVMKLAKKMDAGPLYFQTTLNNLPLKKFEIYDTLAKAGATWLAENLEKLPTPTPQDEEKATFSSKLDKSLSPLLPAEKSAEALFREVVAFEKFPKSTYTFYDTPCIILSAHVSESPDSPLSLECKDGLFLSIDRLQPLSRNPMDPKSFLNGLKNK